MCSSDLAAPAHRGNSHGRETGVEDISAVAGRIHPPRVNGFRIGSDGDIFCNHAKSRASLGEAFSQVQLAGELVFEDIVKRHAVGVFASGGGERLIPMESGQ